MGLQASHLAEAQCVQCDELFSGTPANPTQPYHIHFDVCNGADKHPSMTDNSGAEDDKNGEVLCDHHAGLRVEEAFM